LAKDGLAINAQEMDEFCKEKGFVKWFETSAKRNINIDTSTRFLISEVIIEISLLVSFLTFSLKMMKHEEQRQRSLHRYGGLEKNRLTIHDDEQKRPISGGKCCGGDSSNH
jgi:hypothetical protein